MLKSTNDTLKESFLKDNDVYEEYEVAPDMCAVGDLHNIDLTENEVWIMQCPKKMDIKQLASQAIKMPGRTNFENLETICTDITEERRKEAFAYYHKGKYKMCLLPISGSIIVRNRLKANKAITAEEVDTSFNVTKRMPMPKNLRVRHPLFGTNYKEIDLNDNVKKRLREADECSLNLLKQVISNKASCKTLSDSTIHKKKRKTNDIPMSIKIKKETQNDSDVELISESLDTNERKRQMHSKKPEHKHKHKSKSKKSQNTEILDNLEWLSKI